MPRRSSILSDSERQERRDATRERLEAAARDLLTSDGWARWARARACFHRYSLVILSGRCRYCSCTAATRR